MDFDFKLGDQCHQLAMVARDWPHLCVPQSRVWGAVLAREILLFCRSRRPCNTCPWSTVLQRSLRDKNCRHKTYYVFSCNFL